MRFEQHMSDADALMWAIEKDPSLRSTITLITMLDRPPDPERLLARLERGTRLIPRLRQVPVRAPLSGAPPRWVTQAEVDLDYHLRRVNAPGDGTDRDLLDYAAPIAMQGFDRARPLWEFHVVEGLAGGRAAMIQKIHHSVTDGVGGMRLAALLMDLERDAPEPEDDPEGPEPDRLSALDMMIEAFGHERRRALGMARRAVGRTARAATQPAATVREAAAVASSASRLLAPAMTSLSPVMTGRSLAVRFDTITVAIDELKGAAKRADAKVNDAFVAGVLGGLARYHEHHGQPVEELRMAMPISIRSRETRALAGNQFAPARFVVPLTIADPVERMAAIRQLVGRQRSERALSLTDSIAGLLNRLPTAVVTQVFGSMLKGVDFTTSNVPGTPIDVFLAGARVDAAFPFGPLAGAACNITLLSHVGDADLGINADRAAVPDGDVFLECLSAGFEEIRDLA